MITYMGYFVSHKIMQLSILFLFFQSGLTQAVRDSKISLVEAETQMLDFIKEHVPQGKCPLAGNSVHADKRYG